MITYSEALNRLLNHNEISYDDMTYLMRQMMLGQMEAEMMAALIMGLRMKVETITEISASVNVLKDFSVAIPIENNDNLLDIVGTGGDGLRTFNISTTVMFIAAAMGAKIAKHGATAVSSSSGAADVVAEMGALIDLTPQQVAKCIEQINLGFMYAPKYNQAMHYVAKVRKILGIKTIFNILGPLVNPANAKKQLLGVFHPDLLGIYTHVGKQLGLKRMLVVHGTDGMDEITVTGPTLVAELKDGNILRYQIYPEAYGLSLYKDLSALVVNDSKQSLAIMNAVLDGEKGMARDIVLLNAAAALYCADIAEDLSIALDMAIEAIDSKKAKQKKQEFIQVTRQLAG